MIVQTFFCEVITFSCFLEAVPASPLALHMGSTVSFQVYSIAVKTMKNVRTETDHFLLRYSAYWGDQLVTWRW